MGVPIADSAHCSQCRHYSLSPSGSRATATGTPDISHRSHMFPEARTETEQRRPSEVFVVETQRVGQLSAAQAGGKKGQTGISGAPCSWFQDRLPTLLVVVYSSWVTEEGASPLVIVGVTLFRGRTLVRGFVGNRGNIRNGAFRCKRAQASQSPIRNGETRIETGPIAAAQTRVA
ncbi:hypothetical protein AOQ84DRAFT_69664 [Glonium stellatum]|uniref:Uncharacterized protein n=1 Tax=Glonium stellatum TaxID=574774 RepID=A0A8E2EY05_9PEZI|nr:hypothetical protein AOQ84DRAFT_69664 [Glonium stellatum]